MSDQNLESDLWNDETNMTMKERRGPFLTTLCILSWVGIGLGLMSTLFSYMKGADATAVDLAKLENMDNMGASNPLAESFLGGSLDMLRKTVENFEAINLSTMFVLLLGGLSIFMMYNLKKMGFVIYLVYCIGAPAISLYFLGDSQMLLTTVGIGIFFSIAFVIMYGVNVKRMTA